MSGCMPEHVCITYCMVTACSYFIYQFYVTAQNTYKTEFYVVCILSLRTEKIRQVAFFQTNCFLVKFRGVLRPCRRSMAELFWENCYRLKTVNYFSCKSSSQIFHKTSNMPLIVFPVEGEIFFSAFTLYPEQLKSTLNKFLLLLGTLAKSSELVSSTLNSTLLICCFAKCVFLTNYINDIQYFSHHSVTYQGLYQQVQINQLFCTKAIQM